MAPRKRTTETTAEASGQTEQINVGTTTLGRKRRSDAGQPRSTRTATRKRRSITAAPIQGSTLPIAGLQFPAQFWDSLGREIAHSFLSTLMQPTENVTMRAEITECLGIVRKLADRAGVSGEVHGLERTGTHG